MEMPMDIILRHIGQLKLQGHLKGIASQDIAMAIDKELQEKFVTIPYEEIDAIEVSPLGTSPDKYWLGAGSGPEEVTCGIGSNPNWLFNRAINELALWRRLQGTEEPTLAADKVEAVKMTSGRWILDDEAEAVTLAEPATDITIRATGNPMLWYVGTDRRAYRLDDPIEPRVANVRETQLALALTDISAMNLRDNSI
jgi:hypothetical protein